MTQANTHHFQWSRMLVEDGDLKLANLVTLSRAVLMAPILALLFTGHPRPALVVYVIAAATDAFDGWIARRSGRASSYGAQLDAIVDNLFSIGILVFLAAALPGLVARHPIALTILFGAPLAYLPASWLLTGRLLLFHFWSAKAGALVLFCLWPLIAVTGWEGWIALSATLVALSRIEQLIFIFRGGRQLDAPHGLCKVLKQEGAAV